MCPWTLRRWMNDVTRESGVMMSRCGGNSTKRNNVRRAAITLEAIELPAGVAHGSSFTRHRNCHCIHPTPVLTHLPQRRSDSCRSGGNSHVQSSCRCFNVFTPGPSTHSYYTAPQPSHELAYLGHPFSRADAGCNTHLARLTRHTGRFVYLVCLIYMWPAF